MKYFITTRGKEINTLIINPFIFIINIDFCYWSAKPVLKDLGAAHFVMPTAIHVISIAIIEHFQKSMILIYFKTCKITLPKSMCMDFESFLWKKCDRQSIHNHIVWLQGHDDITGLILGLRPANEKWRYVVTTFLVGWTQTWNQPSHHIHDNFYSLPLSCRGRYFKSESCFKVLKLLEKPHWNLSFSDGHGQLPFDIVIFDIWIIFQGCRQEIIMQL